MENFIVLFFLATLTLFVVGLISPTTGLFWYKGERTRNKVGLFYGLTLLATLFCIGTFYPTDKKKQQADPINQQRTETLVTKNKQDVNEWALLDDKQKEKQAKEIIVGKWLQVLQIGKDKGVSELTVNRNFKTEYKATGDFAVYEEFIPSDGFFDYPHFSSKSQSDKGLDEYKTSYQIVKDEVVFATGTSDQTNEKILFLSDNLCIRKLVEPLTGMEFISCYARVQDGGGISHYQSELSSTGITEINEALKH